MAQAELTISPQAFQWQASARAQRSLRELVWRRFLKHKPAVAGLVAVSAIVVLCLIVPWITNYDPGKTNVEVIREEPSLAHVFGTDELGRDLFVRVWDGGRISILIGVATMLLSIFLGTVIGSIAGFYGGRVDDVLMAFINFIRTVPQLFLLLIFAQLIRSTNDPRLSGGPMPIIVIIGILSWVATALLCTQSISTLKNRSSSKRLECRAQNFRIMLRHLLPNAPARSSSPPHCAPDRQSSPNLH
jgi:peptide/nickel transport system permease protein